MTKVRKVKKSKKYQYNVNRKRMNKKRLPALESDTIKQACNTQTWSRKNFKNLGLVFDLNEDIKNMNRECDIHTKSTGTEKINSSVVKELENFAETSSSTGKNFRFSEDQVDCITYYLDKHGDDYKAMSRDKRNYLQQTWKQIRYKIRLFKSIPAHYNEYLKKKKAQ